MKPVDEIISLWETRKQIYRRRHDGMGIIRALYNGELDVALPEMERRERPAVANLAKRGIDQYAMRIASTMPDVYWPPDRPGFKEHEERARRRRQANLGWWEMNRLPLKLREAARWYVADAWAPVMISPDTRRGIPKWRPRKPTTTYPAPLEDTADICPRDCIFSYTRDWGWILENYPDKADALRRNRDLKGDHRFTIVEWVDASEHALIVVNEMAATVAWESQEHIGSSPIVQLDRYENRCGRTPVMIGRSFALDGERGQFDDAPGVYDMQAKLMALAYVQAKRSVLKEVWVEGRMNETPKEIRPANANTGEVGIIQGGVFREINPEPSVVAMNILDRLERVQRLDAGVAQEMGGESTSNIRTGRRGEQVLSAVVDFPVQEGQEVFAAMLEEGNAISASIAKAYFGDKPTSFYVSWKGAKGRVDYTPNELFGDTYENKVIYSYAGADANNLVVGGGGRVGMGTLSKRSFMEMDPYVEDAEIEHDRIIHEGFEAAVLAAVQQQANDGTIPPIDVAEMAQAIITNRQELFQAIIDQQKAAQERQAAEMPQGAPETMPGLSLPGMGAESGMAPAPNTPSIDDLSSRLRDLKTMARGAA